jgi:DNA topoisomerase I
MKQMITTSRKQKTEKDLYMPETTVDTSSLSHREMLVIDQDYERAAAVASLVYVSDTMPGIIRSKKGKGFSFLYQNKRLQNKSQLERIQKLAIPPAWTAVWICPLENGHLQATGKDSLNRKQYRYHTAWRAVRNETKFHRLYEFGKALPALRLQMEKDISRKDLCEEKVLATVVSLMERTYIRTGSQSYEKLYGSYGLTTLKDKHVAVNGHSIQFSFRGKKGINHAISVKNKRLARIVQACRDIPGKELFQYYDADHNRKSIDSGMVNSYIKQITGFEFSAKDFRTWAGTLNILRSFKSIGEAFTEAERKKKVVEALDEVSTQLGNTRTVCKKYYVHPGIIRLYEEDNLKQYLKDLDTLEEPDDKSGHTGEEKVLMKILKALSAKPANDSQ